MKFHNYDQENITIAVVQNLHNFEKNPKGSDQAPLTINLSLLIQLQQRMNTKILHCNTTVTWVKCRVVRLIHVMN